MQYRMIFAATLALGSAVYASPARPQITKAPRAEHLRSKRQQPDAAGSSVLDAPMTIAAGETFDGGNAVFDRGVSCTGQAEGGDSDAVFILEAGASLSNVIIGPNQVEGVHCNGGCTITNVWWDAVCEDAFSIKKQGDGETTTINGGGAKGAEDKVIQHNGGGTVVINDFTVSDFGKLYRSCGNCKEMPARHVKVSGGSATNGDLLVGINSNMGDTASISGISSSGVKEECTDFEGVVGGGEPKKIGPCSNVSGGGASGGGAGASASVPASEPSASAPAGGDDEDATPTSASGDEPSATADPDSGDAEESPAPSSGGDDDASPTESEEQPAESSDSDSGDNKDDSSDSGDNEDSKDSGDDEDN